MRMPPGLGRYRRTAVGAVLIVLFMLIALMRPVIAPYLHTSREDVVVARVIDGDTIVLADGRHVRYNCMDTPEMNAASADTRRLAEEAKEFNANLVLGKPIRLEYDVDTKDKYGRTLAYVWVGDEMVNAQLVEAGLARAKSYGGRNHLWWTKIQSLEAEAKAAQRGVWAKK
jgi:micrococcal nuclease